MNVKSQIKHYGIFLIGLFIASLGVAFSTKAGLGTSPVASVPYSVSIVNHALTFGWWLNIWSLIQILVQVALLRRKCKPAEIINSDRSCLRLRIYDGFFLPFVVTDSADQLCGEAFVDVGGLYCAGFRHLDTV